MDPLKTASDTVLACWDRTANYRRYIRSLGGNLVALESKMDELDGVYEDVKSLVDRAEEEEWKPKNDAARWLKKVEDLKEEVNKIVAEGKQMTGRNCLCGLCFINCRARYIQSKLAVAKKADLETELVLGRNFKVEEDVAYEPDDLVLERSVRALRAKRDELRDVYKTVKRRVKTEEKQHKVRTAQVGGWLNKVEDLLETEVLEILQAAQDCQSQRNFQLCRGISKRANERTAMLEEKLIEGRGFVVFTYKPDDPLMVEIPLEHIVGADSMFKEVWDWVQDDKVKCIGLFGMGGVGKTTMLDRVHNHFLQVNHDYIFVLRIVVSRPVNLDKIQGDILKKLKLEEDDWEHLEKMDRAALIQRHLKHKNFLLFLDDLWDPINLLEDVGIPCHGHKKKCKIIFTTREEGVCNGMKPDKVKKVECLPPEEALKLFRQNLGEETWSAHPGISNIAARLIHECKYLPLALKIVARAMAGKKELKHWMDAEEDLISRLAKFKDMEQGVLVRLEFSYRYLPDETHRICFLYLSIFPEDHEICKHDVIDLWIGEGFMHEWGNIREARIEGERIFRRLMDACLVESVEFSSLSGEIVRMHDLVREMALWVYSDHGLKKNRVLVQDGMVTESFRLEEFKKWKVAERISMWQVEGGLHKSLANISYSHLSTLAMTGMSLEGLNELLLSMPCLRVLDLSKVIIDIIPYNIWNLINLRYLKITLACRVTVKVPVEIQNLNNLEVLILSYSILLPAEVLVNLSSLRVFCWLHNETFLHHWMVEDDPTLRKDCEIELLEVLQMMQSIEEISVTLVLLEGVEKLLGCPKLPGHLRELGLFNCNGYDTLRIPRSLLRRLENLHSLSLIDSSIRQIGIDCEYDGSEGSPERQSHGKSLSPNKPSRFSTSYDLRKLSHAFFSGCEGLVDVTPLINHAPVLETLYIEYCPSLKEVIVGDVEDDPLTISRLFPCLKHLKLANLIRLERICRRALPFPSLRKIAVDNCPMLEKLPLNCDSAKDSLQVVKGEKLWWEGLQWDDPVSQQVFSAKFISC